MIFSYAYEEAATEEKNADREEPCRSEATLRTVQLVRTLLNERSH